jgi:hypothetical protein
MIIKPVNQTGDSRTGGLQNITVAEIVKRLGFKANCEDDPDKVKNSWGFTVDGVRCGVWDYKGSQKFNAFSTFGPAETLKQVFGEHYVAR